MSSSEYFIEVETPCGANDSRFQICRMNDSGAQERFHGTEFHGLEMAAKLDSGFHDEQQARDKMKYLEKQDKLREFARRTNTQEHHACLIIGDYVSVIGVGFDGEHSIEGHEGIVYSALDSDPRLFDLYSEDDLIHVIVIGSDGQTSWTTFCLGDFSEMHAYI